MRGSWDHAEAARPCEVGDRVEKRARAPRRNVVNSHETVDLQAVKSQTGEKSEALQPMFGKDRRLRSFATISPQYWDQFNGIEGSVIRAL